MRYFKIIQDSQVIGVGATFLKWYTKAEKYYVCDFDDAQAVLDSVNEMIYTTDWLRKAPQGAYPLPTAEVVLIDADEYNDIYEELLDGEPIPVPESEPEPEPQPEPDPEQEAEPRMTVQEMREKIVALEEQLAAAKILLGVE